MANLLYVIIVFVAYITASSCQCITANDIIVNETAIGATTLTLLEGSTKFSLDLLRTLQSSRMKNKESSGLFFSPHSIWSALVVTYMGSQGITEQEMKHVLGLGNTDKITTWEAFRNIKNFNPYKQSSPKASGYNSANRIYFQEGTNFKNCMQHILEHEIAFLDFKKDSEQAREVINTWVEDQTQKRIKDIIPPNSIDAFTNMVIANAVYFKESWEQTFDPEKTARRRFTTPTRNDIFVNMMSTRGNFMYGKSEELQCYALEMPYSGNRLSMMVLLPKNRYSGVDHLAFNLTPDKLRNLFSDMYPRDVYVNIPKFKVEDSFELSSVLSKMGLRSLFDSRRVDLSGFTGQKEFFVDSVHHKTFIDVNEEGTEAAASTVVITSRSARPIGPASFIADYPFVYFIRDNISNAILFLGTVQKPPEFTN